MQASEGTNPSELKKLNSPEYYDEQLNKLQAIEASLSQVREKRSFIVRLLFGKSKEEAVLESDKYQIEIQILKQEIRELNQKFNIPEKLYQELINDKKKLKNEYELVCDRLAIEEKKQQNTPQQIGGLGRFLAVFGFRQNQNKILEDKILLRNQLIELLKEKSKLLVIQYDNTQEKLAAKTQVLEALCAQDTGMKAYHATRSAIYPKAPEGKEPPAAKQESYVNSSPVVSKSPTAKLFEDIQNVLQRRDQLSENERLFYNSARELLGSIQTAAIQTAASQDKGIKPTISKIHQETVARRYKAYEEARKSLESESPSEKCQHHMKEVERIIRAHHPDLLRSREGEDSGEGDGKRPSSPH